VDQSWVAVVDDDDSVRESLPDLLKELGFPAKAFASAIEFVASGTVDQTRCLILDVAMPGMSGPELQRELLQQGRKIPIIFITAQGDEKVRSAVLASGAVAFLLKPFTEAEIRAALAAALGAS
jgi:FixJ family two-component response regulator